MVHDCYLFATDKYYDRKTIHVQMTKVLLLKCCEKQQKNNIVKAVSWIDNKLRNKDEFIF